MNLLQQTSHVLLVIALSAQFVSAWDQSSRNQILKIHNDYRKAVPKACEMKTMTYDMQLENEAKAWAQKCVFEHEMKTRGENIAEITAGQSEAKLIKEMAGMWHGEVKDYTYGQYGCGAACHYTQMVWSETTKVGCYAHRCAHLEKADDNALFLVCFYDPAGNMEGENPYKTKCGSGSSNSNSGNHHGSANTNNGNAHGSNNAHSGNNPSEDDWGEWDNSFGWDFKKRSVDDCVDTSPSCDTYEADGHCQSSKNVMRFLCKETCNLC